LADYDKNDTDQSEKMDQEQWRRLDSQLERFGLDIDPSIGRSAKPKPIRGCLSVFLILLSVLLIAGVSAAILFVVNEDSVQVLSPFFCPENTDLESTSVQTFSGRTTSQILTFACVNSDFIEVEDVTDEVTMALVIVIAVLVGGFVLLLFLGIIIRPRQYRRVRVQKAGLTSTMPGYGYTVTSNVSDAHMQIIGVVGEMLEKVNAAQNPDQIKERLLTLRESYEAGLITSDEYEKKRQAILDEL